MNESDYPKLSSNEVMLMCSFKASPIYLAPFAVSLLFLNIFNKIK